MSDQHGPGSPPEGHGPPAMVRPERRSRARTVGRELSAFMAQMLGQGGVRRGVRGGAPAIDAAQTAYLETEWSGDADRRSPRGRLKRTQI